jgi:hypothetical protein
MPTATERLLGRTYRPPGYDPGDRPGYSPARSGSFGRTRAPALAADDVDVRIEEAPKPPEGARSWDAQKVASVVDECCEQAGLSACSELFMKHGVDGEVLEQLLAAPAAELKLLGEGPGAACAAAATIAGYGARCKLHARLCAYVATHESDASWTVGETALIVRHVLEDARLDPKAAEEISKELQQHVVDGRALSGLTADDLVRIGKGGDGSFGAAKLCEAGVRITLARGLQRFVKGHSHKNFDRLCDDVAGLAAIARQAKSPSKLDAVTICPETGAPRSAWPAKRDELLVQLAGTNPAYELLDPSLRKSSLRRPVAAGGSQKRETRQVVVPVFMTLMVKKLAAERGEDSADTITLVGTLIQRPLLYDLTRMPRVSGDTATPTFDMRINDGESKVDECFERRKVVPETTRMLGANWLQTSTTYAAKMPMKLYSVFSAHPFHIMAAEVMVELTSFTCRRPPGEDLDDTTFEVRPNLMCHIRDFRNLVSVRDYDRRSAMDEMKKWEIMNSSPTVDFQADGNGEAGTKPFYTPKVKLTFYLYRDPVQPFLESLMPIIFCIFANGLNVLFAVEFDEHLGNTLAIALALVFMIPRLSKNESFLETFQLNQIYVLLIFLALMVSAATYPICRSYLKSESRKQYRKYVKIGAIVLSIVPLVIPLINLSIYLHLRHALKKSPHTTAANPMTFNGRPGSIGDARASKKKGWCGCSGHVVSPMPKPDKNPKGSSVDFGVLRQFFQPPRIDAKKPRLARNGDLIDESNKSIKQYLTVYEDERAKPWRLKNKHFICGYEKEYLMWKSAQFTSWIFSSRHVNDANVLGSGAEKKRGKIRL